MKYVLDIYGLIPGYVHKTHFSSDIYTARHLRPQISFHDNKFSLQSPVATELFSLLISFQTPVDQENIGRITFWPPNGFPFAYYPYMNQEGYRQPIVFARFENATNGVVINVWCKAWAYNIQHHRVDNAGSIHFELLMD